MDISSGSLENGDVSASSFFSGLHMAHISKPCEIGICCSFGMENCLIWDEFSPVAINTNSTNPVSIVLHSFFIDTLLNIFYKYKLLEFYFLTLNKH